MGIAYSESSINLPDGNYNGTWSAYYVQMVVGNMNIRFKVSVGLKTMIPQPCTINVSNKRATVNLHNNAPKK